VRLVDANVLLYAVNTSAPHHERCRRWLDRALSGDETVAFAWSALLAFARLSTRHDVFERPLTVDEALGQIQAWTNAAPAVILDPGPQHSTTLLRLLESLGSGGNLVNDAHLAALARENRATVVSFDGDFARFEVPWVEPD
jgi:toxin-antitoxin system PIN domain toxin